MKDADLVAFLKRSQAALRKEGVIILKENVCLDEDGEPAVLFHEEDSSVTRYVLSSTSPLEDPKDATQDPTCTGRRSSAKLV
jgi:hypothetical protein